MEQRTLVASAPTPTGSDSIDRSSRFTAGREGAVLDRTPMPGESKGAVNGGYAGLAPLVRTLTPGETWTLRYRIVIGRDAFTPVSLPEAIAG